jgi:beta-glucosidase
MTKSSRSPSLFLLAAILGAGAPLAGLAQESAPLVDKPVPECLATKPEPREGGWMKRHETMNKRTQQGGVDLAFVGDSITQGWEGAGKKTWAKYYAGRNAANYGISGDRTEHVLWRIDNGNFEGISPKLIVIMIGTNNTGHRTEPAQETADGIRAILQRLRKMTPESKILLLGVFPRGERPDAAKRKQNEAINAIVKGYADGETIHYLDIKEEFENEDGTLPKDIMPDSLHLRSAGYEIWAEAIEPKVKELMGEK